MNLSERVDLERAIQNAMTTIEVFKENSSKLVVAQAHAEFALSHLETALLHIREIEVEDEPESK